MVVFGNQSTSLDVSLVRKALSLVTENLENLQAASLTGWNLAHSSMSTDSVYQKSITVSDISPCVKYASSTVLWQTSPLRPQETKLFTVLTSPAEAIALGA